MVRLRFLGSAEVENSDGSPARSVLAQPRRVALLATIAVLPPGAFRGRDELIGLFWPEKDEDSARNALRQALHFLRQSLGEDVIRSRGDHALTLDADHVTCDVGAFRAAAAAGSWTEAVALYRGELLSDVPAVGPVSWEHWLDSERATLRARFCDAARKRIRELDAVGEHELAVVLARRVLREVPFDERHLRKLMRLLAGLGDRAQALFEYDVFVDRLARELDVAPDPETTALASEIRAATASATPGSGPGAASPRDPAIAHASRGEAEPPPGPSLVPTSSPEAFPKVRQRWARPAAAVAVAVAAGGALSAALLPLWRRSPAPEGPPLVSTRVLVAGFVNETGQPELDDLGRIAADWLARDLQRIQAIEVIDPRAALFSAPPDSVADQEATPLRLAARLGAGTVVSGSYYRVGDSLRLQAKITETATGILVRALSPVSGTLEDPLGGLGELSAEVAGAAAARLDPGLTPLGGETSHPHSYAAYQEYVLAMEEMSRWNFVPAARHARRALELDSTFTMAGLVAATMGPVAQRDSLLQAIDADRGRLTILERHLLDAISSQVRGQRMASYQAAVSAYRLAPTVPEVVAIAAPAALYANYPRAAAGMLRGMNWNQGLLQEYNGNWVVLDHALHMLEDFEGELSVARDGRRRLPDQHIMYLHEARALAALGRVQELERVVHDLAGLPALPDLTEGDVCRQVSLELKAHGFTEAGRQMAERGVQWHRTNGSADAPEGVVRLHYAKALQNSGRLREADAYVRGLLAEAPENLEFLGMLGEIAAALGDRTEAENIDRELGERREPYLRGHNTLHRALIASILGDRDRAVALLRASFAEGTEYAIWVHREPGLDPLRDYAPFQELVRPKG